MLRDDDGAPVSEDRARRYVPAEYTLAHAIAPQVFVEDPSADTSNNATVAVWNFACDWAAVPGSAPGPARLSFLAVHINRPGRDIDPYAGVPPNTTPNVWSHYVVWAHTDNPSIARRFQEAGAPIELIDDYGFQSRTERDDIAVDSKTSPYRVTNNAQVDDVAFGRHDHANEFWFGATPHAAVLKLRIHDANDLDCVFTVQPDCRGEIDAPAGGAVAELLGSPRVVTRWALRHHKVPIINARVTALDPGEPTPPQTALTHKETTMTITEHARRQRRQPAGAARRPRRARRRPEARRVRVAGELPWENGTHSYTTIERFRGLGGEQSHRTEFGYDVDHPECFASEDHGPTPVEFVLVGLAGCLTAGVASVAQMRDIQLRSRHRHARGRHGRRSACSASTRRAQRLRLRRASTSTSTPTPRPADIEALVAQSQKRSAVYDIIANPTNVVVDVNR